MKFTKYILSFAAAIGMMAGCYKPELEQLVAPEDVIPPVLEAFDDLVFTTENLATDSLIFTWAPVGYGAQVEIDYALEFALPGGKKQVITSGIYATEHKGYYDIINSALRYTLGVEAGKATDVEFYVSAKFLDYEKVYSAPVTASVKTVDPVAPVLAPFEGKLDINVDNVDKEKANFGWTPANYGKNVDITYSLEVEIPGGDVREAVVTGLKGKEAEVKYKDLNNAILFKLNVPENQATDVNFYIAAQIGTYTKVYSEPVIINVTATASEKEYAKLFVVGSYEGWGHSGNMFLYDFEMKDQKYEGVVDFGEDHSKNEFKITAGAWGKDEHSATGTQDPEKAVTLVVGGGDNITAFTEKRYYHFTFDRALTLTPNLSFDKMGVIGANGDWENDIVMTLSKANQKFYADVEFASDSEFKFRLDGSWDTTNWGVNDGEMAVGGGNIPAPAGKYRIYFNLNNLAAPSYELNAEMYGQEEGAGAPEQPEQPENPGLVGWGVVCSLTGWADGADFMMTSDGTWHVVKGVEFAAGDEFKIRLDGKWDTSFGGEFAANEEVTLTSDNGANLKPAAGTYDIYFDPATGKAWFINDGSYPGGGAAPEASEWGVVGSVNNWGETPDLVMYKTSTAGLFVAYNLAMPDGDFKIRANNAWVDTANYGLLSGGAVEVDHAYDLVCSGGSGNMTLAAGNYDIWFDLTNSKVYIMTPGKAITEAEGGEAVVPDPSEQTWHMVGSFNGWNPGDAAYAMTAEGDFYVFKNFTAAEGCEAKFAPGAWNNDKGGDGTFAVNTACPTGSSNIAVAAGIYDVYLAKDLSVYYFMEVGKTPAN